MDKDIFKEACALMEIEYEKLFAHQKDRKLKVRARFECQISSDKLSASTKYIVRYYAHENLWLVWRNLPHKKRTKFSLSYISAMAAYEKGEMYVMKNIEYSGWGTEYVAVFNAKGIKKFLNGVKEEL